MKKYWSGVVTRLDMRTGDGRKILGSGFSHRSLPMPALWQKAKLPAHQGAVVVGRVLGIRTEGSQVMAWGDWMDPEIIPEVRQAYALAEAGVNGFSVDPSGYTIEVDNSGEKPTVVMTEYQMAGVTAVSIAAFDELRLTMHDDIPDSIAPIDMLEGLVAAGSPEVTHTGAMIALVPSEADIKRLAVEGGEPAGELHCTLFFLGESKDFTPESASRITELIRGKFADSPPVHGDGFALSIFNPSNEDRETCIVVGVSGDEVTVAHSQCLAALEGYPSDLPEQHSPYIPHVTLIYTDDASRAQGLTDRTGPITFDRVRVAFGGNSTDIPLGKKPSQPAQTTDAEMDMTEDIETANEGEFAVSGAPGWESLPIAPRKQQFDADDAIHRILTWAGNDSAKARKMFLWHDPKAQAGTREAYRLPVGDIINGGPHLVHNAIYAAAALINGAHGGLPGIPDAEKSQMRGVITRMYAAMGRAYSDPKMRAPWERPGAAGKMEASVEPEGTLVASGGPLKPPAAWFAKPEFDAPTGLRVGEDGRISGHLAIWDTCHVAPEWNTKGVCVAPPHSETDYAMFHTGEVLTADGDYLPVGRITLGTGHAPAELSVIPAIEHYDNSGATVAVVRAGEDDHGIWVAGSLVAGVTPEQVAELRRSPLSGDWRRYAGNLEMVAALAVNTGGFPVARVDGGRQVSLVAAGMLSADTSTPPSVIHTDPQEPDPAALQARVERLATLHTVDQFERSQKLAAMKAGTDV